MTSANGQRSDPLSTDGFTHGNGKKTSGNPRVSSTPPSAMLFISIGLIMVVISLIGMWHTGVFDFSSTTPTKHQSEASIALVTPRHGHVPATACSSPSEAYTEIHVVGPISCDFADRVADAVVHYASSPGKNLASSAAEEDPMTGFAADIVDPTSGEHFDAWCVNETGKHWSCAIGDDITIMVTLS